MLAGGNGRNGEVRKWGSSKERDENGWPRSSMRNRAPIRLDLALPRGCLFAEESGDQRRPGGAKGAERRLEKLGAPFREAAP
ncbi:hypothetical protein KM043_006661 [Ampulex compressa]|nr:hypothetical protein KM043_006661 [Ampulex compressa]